MDGYVTLPAGWTADDARPWVEQSLEHVRALPAKKPKPAKAAKPKTTKQQPTS